MNLNNKGCQMYEKNISDAFEVNQLKDNYTGF